MLHDCAYMYKGSCVCSLQEMKRREPPRKRLQRPKSAPQSPRPDMPLVLPAAAPRASFESLDESSSEILQKIDPGVPARIAAAPFGPMISPPPERDIQVEPRVASYFVMCLYCVA